jgi:hypothetical protein
VLVPEEAGRFAQVLEDIQDEDEVEWSRFRHFARHAGVSSTSTSVETAL